MTASLWASLATVIGVWSITVLSPGPNFFATAYTATAQNRRTGLFVALGIAVGTSVWATGSLMGLGILFQHAAWLYMAVKIIGGLYLIYTGIRMVMTARQSLAQPDATSPDLTSGRAFWRGLIVDLSNPKAAIFFTSLFAVAVPPTAPGWFQIMIVSLVVTMAGGWYMLVAVIVNAGPIARFLAKAQKTIGYVTGAVFMGLGVKIIADR